MGTALITGASAGLGVEFARLFAREGHSVILVARRRDRMEALAEELRKSHPPIKTWVIAIDLSKPHAGQELYRQVQSMDLSVDFLVNNAGFGQQGAFADHDLKVEMEMIDLNVRTLVETTHLFLQDMLKRKSGRILNVGSTAGFQPGPYLNTYYATKAFVNSFSEALNSELRGTGVTCTVLAPGATASEFAERAKMNASTLGNSGLVAKPEFVVLDGYQAMMAGRALKISGPVNWLAIEIQRLLPRSLVRKFTERTNQNRGI